MKKHKRLASVLLSVLAIFLLLPMAASASDEISFGTEASLTIHNSFGEMGLQGVQFDLYLVSTMDAYGELTPVDTFQQYASDLDIQGENDDAWMQLAGTLEREIRLGNLGALLPTDSALTGGDGAAAFPSGQKRLPLGLYLVMGTRVEQDGYVYATAPFFVTLPRRDSVSDAWDYSVTVNSKLERDPILSDFRVIKIWEDQCHLSQRPDSVTIQLMCDGAPYGQLVTLPQDGKWEYTWHDLETNHDWTVTESPVEGYKTPEIQREGTTFWITNTCDKPTEPSKPTLPQTGQLWWLVPVLTAAGLLLMALGLLRRKNSE